MKKFVILSLLVLASPVAFADEAKPPAAQPSQDARLVPALKDGQFVGLKVYAIRAGGRFAAASFENGDTILAIDDVPVTSDAGTRALHDKVINGDSDAVVTVTRRGQTLRLNSRARK